MGHPDNLPSSFVDRLERDIESMNKGGVTLDEVYAIWDGYDVGVKIRGLTILEILNRAKVSLVDKYGEPKIMIIGDEK